VVSTVHGDQAQNIRFLD